MAQARWTGLSMGGPTYVDDPRVQEAVALGQMLLRSREAAQTQADRLFARKQETAQFDERRRQFNEEQKRLADAQKMQAADAERRAGLAERELQQRATEFQGQQQGAAEDRLFRRQSQQESIAANTAEGERERAARMALQRQADLDARARMGEEQKFSSNEARLREAFQSTQAADKQRLERELADLAYQRALEVEKSRAERDAADRKSQEDRAQARLDAERQKNEATITREREKTEGTAEQQRAATIAARAARFRQALEAEADPKKGRLSEEDQRKVVRRAFQAATQPDLDPQRMTRELMVLGPEGEALANAELAKIADEFFPVEDFVAPTGDFINGPADVAKLLFAAPLLAAEHPDYLNNLDVTRNFATWLANKFDNGRGVVKRSAGRDEASRLFQRK